MNIQRGSFLLLVRGRCLLRAFNLLLGLGFSRKRRLRLGEPQVVVCVHKPPCSNPVWQKNAANQDVWCKYLHIVLFPLPFPEGWIANPRGESLTDCAFYFVAPLCPQALFQSPTFAKWKLAKQNAEAALCTLLPCTSPGAKGQEGSVFSILQRLSCCPREKAAFVCDGRALCTLLAALCCSKSCVGCEARSCAGTSEVVWVMGVPRPANWDFWHSNVTIWLSLAWITLVC